MYARIAVSVTLMHSSVISDDHLIGATLRGGGGTAYQEAHQADAEVEPRPLDISA